MRVDVVVGTRFSNRACSSFGNCTSLRAITEGEPRLVRTCSSFGNCTSLRDRVALGPVRVDRDPCSSFGNCTSLRVCLRPEEDRCLPLLQFFRELHFIEGLCLPRHRHWSSLQFFRELHFIEGEGRSYEKRTIQTCSSFGNCTSLRGGRRIRAVASGGLAVLSGTALH